MSDNNQRITTTVEINGQQAADELKKLQREAEVWRDKMIEAGESGDVKAFKKAEQELRKVNSQMRIMQKNSVDIDNVLKNLSTAGPKELQRTLKNLNKELTSGRIQRGSKEWDQLQASIRRVRTEIERVNAEGRASQGIFSRISDGFNKYFAMLASTIAGLTGLTMTARKCVDEYAKMQEAQAQVVKYTGMAAEEVDGLNDTFKKLDTRTPRERLNALAGDAGRLGIKGRDGILEFVDAADKINVALGEDLGEDAVKNIGKLALMFGEDKTIGLRGAMLATGSAINEVAQNSSASESYIVDFAAQVAGAANQAGIAQANLIGFASVLDQNMLASEKAATAFQKVMMKMYQDPSKLAKLAGIDVKQFSEILKKDANEALLMFFDALSKKGGLADLAPIFKELKLQGEGAASVLSVLAGKVSEVRSAQKQANEAYIEGTSIINEFNVQNSTVQAEIDKRKKQFKDISIELGKKLLPVMKYTISSGSLLLNVVSALTIFFMKYGVAILYAGSILLTYVAALKLATWWEKKHKDAQLLTIAVTKLRVFWDKVVAASTWLYIAATSSLAGNTVTARLATEAFFKTIKMHPFAMALAAIMAVAGAIFLLSRRTNAQAKVMESINRLRTDSVKKIEAEKTEILAFLNIARNETRSKEERLSAIRELNRISPEYLGNLKFETINTNAAKESVDRYIESLIRLTRIESAKNRLNTVNSRLADLDNEGKDDSLESAVKNSPQNVLSMLTFGLFRTSGQKRVDEMKMLKAEAEKLKEVIETDIKVDITDKTLLNARTLERVNEELAEARKNLEQMQNMPLWERAYVDNGYDQVLRNIREKVKTLEAEQKALTPTGTAEGGEMGDKERKERIKSLEDTASVYKAHITSLYAIGQINKQEYDAFLEEGDKDLLQKKMALYAKESSEYNNMLVQLRQMDITHREQCTQETLSEIDKRTKEEKRSLAEMYADQLIDKEAYEEGIFRIEYEALKRKRDHYSVESKEFQDYQAQLDELSSQDQVKRKEEYEKKLSSFRKSYRKESLTELKDQELTTLEFLHSKGLISEEEYEKYRLAIKKKYARLGLMANEDVSSEDISSPDETSSGLLSAFFKQDIDKRRAQLDHVNELHDQEIISDQEFYQRKAEINAEFYQSVVDKAQQAYAMIGSVVSAYSDFNQASQDLETAKINKKYDAEIKAAGNNSKKVSRLEEQKEKELAKVKSRYADKAFKMQIAQGLAQTAMGAISAYSSAAAVPLIGYILAPIAAGAAVAAGMLQMAAIYKQHQASKMGYYDGGYTPRGRWNEEQGVVHSNEFVANRFAVRNKEIRPVFDLINRAQKNNTIGSLTASDVSRVLGNSNDSADSNSPDSWNTDPDSIPIAYIVAVLGQTAEAIGALNERLQHPFEAFTRIDGSDGFENQYKRYKRLMANKSR